MLVANAKVMMLQGEKVQHQSKAGIEPVKLPDFKTNLKVPEGVKFPRFH